ncbi:hypothetical protein C8R43DRAFT_111977 [Mycena crocata]|nr:hypothetical protein C8R43DRAFT_111977 [Mycena crocata]
MLALYSLLVCVYLPDPAFSSFQETGSSQICVIIMKTSMSVTSIRCLRALGERGTARLSNPYLSSISVNTGSAILDLFTPASALGNRIPIEGLPQNTTRPVWISLRKTETMDIAGDDVVYVEGRYTLEAIISINTIVGAMLS